jgi:hypothetical protein
MKTRLTLKPGQHGTKALAAKYGDNLVCVRFRYDAELRQRVKTVELIVERSSWEPPAPRFTDNTVVALRIEASNLALRTKAKAAGARWDPEVRLWVVKYGKIAGTVLEKHIHIDRS